MSNFWPLFKLTVNNTFGLSFARHTYLVQKKRLWEPILIIIGIVGAGGFFEFLLYLLDRGFVAAGQSLGQPQIVFTFSFLIASVLVLFFGLMAVVSIFYFSDDLVTLVPLPLGPGSIVLAKFGVIMIGEYIAFLLAMAPAAIAYAQAVGGGVVYWASVLGVVLLGPVVPLAISSVVSILVMRFINRRHRDILVVVFGSAFALGMILLQTQLMAKIPQNATAEYLQRLLSGQISLVNLIGRAFPPAIWATDVIGGVSAGARLLAAAAYVGVSALAVWVMALVGGKFFYGGLIGGSELARRRLTAKQAAAARALARARTVQTGVVRALFQREWRLFMRVPIFVFNGFAAALLVPLLFVLGFQGIVRDPEISKLVQAVENSPNAPFYAALAIAGLTLFVVSLNTTASTAVSREGRYLWISKVIPATPEQQTQAKLLFSLAGALVCAVPLLAIFAVALKMSLFHVLVATVLSLLASGVVGCAGLLFDTARPLLKWTNPQQAVKNNLNAVIPMPIAAGLGAGLYFLVQWLYRGLGLGEVTAVVIVAAVLVAVGVPVYRLTLSSARRLYERLEP